MSEGAECGCRDICGWSASLVRDTLEPRPLAADFLWNVIDFFRISTPLGGIAAASLSFLLRRR